MCRVYSQILNCSLSCARVTQWCVVLTRLLRRAERFPIIVCRLSSRGGVIKMKFRLFSLCFIPKPTTMIVQPNSTHFLEISSIIIYKSSRPVVMLDVWSGFEEEDEGEKKKQMTKKKLTTMSTKREKKALWTTTAHINGRQLNIFPSSSSKCNSFLLLSKISNHFIACA